MPASSFRPRLASLCLTAAAALAATSSRADTVEATSTTLLNVRQELRNFGTGGELFRVAPLYELINLSATDIKNPLTDRLEVGLSTWGAVDLGPNLRWDNGAVATSRFDGDLDIAYVKGEFLYRNLVVRLGRQHVAEGAGRMTHLDGGDLVLRLPLGFGLSGYVGSPVSYRFDARGTERTWNEIRGDLAYGGRVFWVYPRAEIGASLAFVDDKFIREATSTSPTPTTEHVASRRDISADLRLIPWDPITVLGYVLFNTSENRWAEIDTSATYAASRQVQVTADYRHTEPDLFLPRDSILAVFAADRRDDVGGILHLSPIHAVSADLAYHYLREQEGRAHGHEARGRVTWHPRTTDTSVGVESVLLDNPSNRYVELRGFASQRLLGRINVTVDLQNYWFREEINGQKGSFIATGTLGYELGRGFAVQVAGSGGSTPFYESRFDLIAKLVYNQTYHVREVLQ